MAKILETSELSQKLKQRIKSDLSGGSRLTLASLVVSGSDYSSQVYITQQQKLAQELGSNLDYRLIYLEASESLERVLEKINQLNKDNTVTGIVFNKPFPKAWKEEEIFRAIAPDKDIEGMNPYNLGRLALGNPLFIPPTVLSVLELIKFTGLALRGKKVTIIGASSIIGKPLALLLADKLATVTIAQIGTYEAGDLESYCRQADVLISAAGVPGLVKGDWIKKGAVVIDVGTAEKSSKISGDVEFEKAKESAAAITPVPGGVGRLTTLFLFDNLLRAERLNKKP